MRKEKRKYNSNSHVLIVRIKKTWIEVVISRYRTPQMAATSRMINYCPPLPADVK